MPGPVSTPLWRGVLFALSLAVPAALTIRWPAADAPIPAPAAAPRAAAPSATAAAARELRAAPAAPPRRRTLQVAPERAPLPPAAAPAAPPEPSVGAADCASRELRTQLFRGAGFDGADAHFSFQRLRCLAVDEGLVQRLHADSQQMERERERSTADTPSATAGAASARNALAERLWADYRRSAGELAYDLLRYAGERPNRAQVKQVVAGSPAEQAGFQVGDAVRAYDGQRIFGARELASAARNLQDPRGTIRVEIERAGRLLDLYVPPGLMGLLIGDQSLPPVL
jgi:hypothetical protein